MEITEKNNTVRTATFEILTSLSSLEQLIYSAYYDQDNVAGNPRIGWVLVIKVVDLSDFAQEDVQVNAVALKSVWAKNWNQITASQTSVNQLEDAIASVRSSVKSELQSLQ